MHKRANTLNFGYNEQLGVGQIFCYNRDPLNQVDLCSNWAFGTQIFIQYNWVFIITEFVITEF